MPVEDDSQGNAVNQYLFRGRAYNGHINNFIQQVASSQLQLLSSPPLLSPVEREMVCAVLEDCVDQLAVLAGIIPSHTDRPTAVETVRRSLDFPARDLPPCHEQLRPNSR